MSASVGAVVSGTQAPQAEAVVAASVPGSVTFEAFVSTVTTAPRVPATPGERLATTTTPSWWPAGIVYSVGSVGNLKVYIWPGVTLDAWPDISESRFEESRMPRWIR